MKDKKITKKKVTKKPLKSEEFLIDISLSILEVEQCGYRASFTSKEHIEFVTHMMENLEGYKRLTKTLSKAINLIEHDND